MVLFLQDKLHFKGPHDGIGGTVKRSTYQAVQTEKVVVNTAREFAVAAQEHSKVEVMYLDNADVINLPLDDAIPLPGTLKVHHVDVCNIDKALVMKKIAVTRLKMSQYSEH